jgi:hypothetical protein
MRVERRKMGIRIRVVMNRTEVREIAKAVLNDLGRLPKELADHSHRTMPLYLGRARVRGAANVTADMVERPCRALANTLIAVPVGAKFTVAVDGDGLITGATLQWWDASEEHPD